MVAYYTMLLRLVESYFHSSADEFPVMLIANNF